MLLWDVAGVLCPLSGLLSWSGVDYRESQRRSLDNSTARIAHEYVCFCQCAEKQRPEDITDGIL